MWLKREERRLTKDVILLEEQRLKLKAFIFTLYQNQKLVKPALEYVNELEHRLKIINDLLEKVTFTLHILETKNVIAMSDLDHNRITKKFDTAMQNLGP